MSIFKGACWQCETCGNIDNSKPWDCPACNKEVCEWCFDIYAICKECSEGKTDDELKVLSGMDWDEDENEEVFA